MRIEAVRFFIGTFIFCITTQALGQTLWQGAEYGMSVEDVASIFPDAKQPTDPHRLSGDPPAKERLRIDGIELVDRSFIAQFFFTSSELVQVTLKLDEEVTHHTAKIVFDSLAEALSSKYGKEVSRKEKSGLLKMVNTTWVNGRTNITMVVLTVGDTDATLNLVYQVRVAEEADKL